MVSTLSMVSELSGSRVAALLVLGKSPRQGSCRGHVGRPSKGVAEGSPSCPFAHHASGLSTALAVTYLCFFCLAKHGRRRGYDCPCTSKRGTERPLLVYTDRSPGPGPHISAKRCRAKPRTVRRHGSVLIPCASGGRIGRVGRLPLGRGAEPRPCPSIKRGEGQCPSAFISFLLGPFLPFAMVRGRVNASTAATRASF